MSFRPYLLFGLLLLASCTATKTTIPDGVYWSAHISEYLVVRNGVYHSYQWSPFACINSISGLIPSSGQIKQQLGQLKIKQHLGDKLVFVRISDSMTIDFQLVEKLPAYCGLQVVDTALSQWTTLYQTIELFGYKFQDATKRALLDQIKVLDSRIDDSEFSEVQLFNTLSAALSATEDRHAFLYSRHLSLYWSAVKASEPILELPGKAYCNNSLTISNQPKAMVIRVSRLHSLESDSPYESRQLRCLQEFSNALQAANTSGVKNIIVDLRNNPGGSLIYAADLLAIFTGMAHQTLSYIGELEIKTTHQYTTSKMSGHLYVALNKNTASAAEHLALALIHAGYSPIGEHSAGAFSPSIVKTLPNGWFFGFSMYRNLYDSLKRPVPEGIGIKVTCPLLPSQSLIECL